MANNTKKIIGQRINTVLAIKNIKQKDLATAIGVSDNIISYYVSGKRTPNTEQIIAISKHLKVSSDYLLGLSDVQSQNIELKAICEYTGLSEEALQGITKTMQKAINFDDIFIDGHLEFEEPQILLDNNIINNDEFDIICSQFTKKSEAITEKNIYNKLFSLSPNQIHVITALRNVITAKLKESIVTSQLGKKITNANDFFQCESSEIENKANTQKNDYFKNNALLTFNDTLKDDYSYRKWQLSETLNKFSETIIKEILGESNANN